MISPRPSGAAKLLAARNTALFESLESMLFPRSGRWQPKKKKQERRATSRVMREVVCEERRGQRRHYRLTWDLSTFGLSTHSGPKYPLGTRLQVSLHVPDDLTGPISFMADVVGVNRATGGMRLAFRNPGAMAVRRLHRFLFGQESLEVH